MLVLKQDEKLHAWQSGKLDVTLLMMTTPHLLIRV